jgi:hypothetical protein
VSELSAALRSVVTDASLAERFGWNGRARVVSCFDIIQCTAELESIYDDVCLQTARPSVDWVRRGCPYRNSLSNPRSFRCTTLATSAISPS